MGFCPGLQAASFAPGPGYSSARVAAVAETPARVPVLRTCPRRIDLGAAASAAGGVIPPRGSENRSLVIHNRALHRGERHCSTREIGGATSVANGAAALCQG